jgi:hypothetical protein
MIMVLPTLQFDLLPFTGALDKPGLVVEDAFSVFSDPLVLGKMGAAYGIRGWLKVFSSTEDAESIFDYQPQRLQWRKTL